MRSVNTGRAARARSRREHPLLHVHRDHPPRGADAASELEGEEPHAAPRLEHRHALADVRREHRRRDPPAGAAAG